MMTLDNDYNAMDSYMTKQADGIFPKKSHPFIWLKYLSPDTVNKQKYNTAHRKKALC